VTNPGLAGTPEDPASGLDAHSLRVHRLRRDRELLQRTHPALTFDIDQRRATAVAAGPLAIEMPDGSVETVEVRLEFTVGYPSRAPSVYDAARRWDPSPSRHIEPDGRMCLYLTGVDEPRLQDRPEGLLDVMHELETFVKQQFILDSQRRFDPDARFPGPEWAHGRDAYKAFVADVLANEPEAARRPLWEATAGPAPRRDEPCVCGSGHPFGDCHFETRKRLRRAVWYGALDGVTYADLLAHTDASA
jgi:hypothetical protein